MNNKIKQTIFSLIGLLIMAGGLGIVHALPLQNSYPIESLCQNVWQMIGPLREFSIFNGAINGLSIVIFIFNIIFILPLVLFTLFVSKNFSLKKALSGLFPALTLSFPEAMVYGLLKDPFKSIDSDALVFFFVLGLIVASLGTAMVQVGNMINFSNDELIEQVTKKYNKSFALGKIIFDVATILAFLLTVLYFNLNPNLDLVIKSIGLITILLALVPGVIIDFFKKTLRKNKTIRYFRDQDDELLIDNGESNTTY